MKKIYTVEMLVVVFFDRSDKTKCIHNSKEQTTLSIMTAAMALFGRRFDGEVTCAGCKVFLQYVPESPY